MQERPYSSQYDARTRAVAVSGAIDELSEATFRADLLAAEDGSGLAAVDLSDVDYFPSVAVSGLVATLKTQKERGSQMAEVVVSDGCVAQRVLELCAIPHRVR